MSKSDLIAIQKRDIIVTQIINELGVTIETNTKPLIRCGECEHFWKYSDLPTKCVFHLSLVNADDFCSYGESKEELNGSERLLKGKNEPQEEKE